MQRGEQARQHVGPVRAVGDRRHQDAVAVLVLDGRLFGGLARAVAEPVPPT
ncbi:hypothetical protein ACIHEJ_30970 [Streptomyces sp. NPDC052301]|uniref:hypothetical protein n=1 Tax=Streptomyces sp. NPDC052301 TaxID=3365687 RepID=UPI0037D767E2